MSDISGQHFGNFELGDNVYELGGGVIPETAELLEFDLPSRPTAESLGNLVGKIGKNKVLSNNEEVTAIDLETAVDLVERSHVQDRLNRSFASPGFSVAGDRRPYDKVTRGSRLVAVDAGVSTAGVPNWTDRIGKLWVDMGLDVPVYLASGNRVMDQKSDVAHPYVERVQSKFGRYPSEAEYVGGLIVPKLAKAGIDVLPTAYPTGDGDQIAARFFADNPGLLEKRLAVARVGNAGIQLAAQMRGAAREIEPSYDSDPEDPQLFVLTDTRPIAHTREQIGDPKNYQSPYTALRQMALTAKLIHLAAGGE